MPAAVSIVYVTNRGVTPLVSEPARSQYDLLASCLRAQTSADFEVVVVDQGNPLPRPELEWLGGRACYVRPPDTPWRKLGAFCAASARNAGLRAARGGIVFGLDDCTSFPPTLIERVAAAFAQGWCLVPQYRHPNGALWAQNHGAARRGGILAYPREFALKLGGYEERFDGGLALEDWEFSERLAAAGVRWLDAPDLAVTIHPHVARSAAHASKAPLGYQRCELAVYGLLHGQARANRPWTQEELLAFGPTCRFLDHDKQCKVMATLINTPSRHPGAKNPCCRPERPTAAALGIMSTYEVARWTDLGA